jgi:hypothetical protein
MHCSSNGPLPMLHEGIKYQKDNWKSPKQNSGSARREALSAVFLRIKSSGVLRCVERKNI